ncbi:MAG: DUF2062 domain-containing protein [Paludibacteraceae bacterium]|nr:DUF2062 domain-containing protein [Paludibacteraceae bacterium]
MDRLENEQIRQAIDDLHIVVLIPTYNNEKTLMQVIDSVQTYTSHILVVNDGSTDSTASLLASRTGITVLSYEKNRGKGHALKYGMRYAASLGYDYAVTLDSDGQHYADDIAVFVRELQQHPGSMLVGARDLHAENMPGKNTFANRFSNFWFRVETGIRMDDTQSGFRAYPLRDLPKMRFVGSGYEFEVEVLVRMAWKDVRVANVPVKVYYPPAGERVSHFKPLRDFTRISLLNTYLVLVALLVYYPWRFLRKLSWNNVKRYLNDNVVHTPESNFRLACAFGLGVCVGIWPVWGYQLIIAWALAKVFGLNKLVTLIGNNISLPPFIPFVLFGSYWLGCKLLSSPMLLDFENISISTLATCGIDYVVGALALSVLAGMAGVLLVWLILAIFRRKS